MSEKQPVVSRRRGWIPLGRAWTVLALVLLLGACGQANQQGDAYGGPQNHIHDLLALRDAPHTVLLATHIGLYRTSDGGGSWTEVAGGDGQPMDGLMIFKLAQSTVDAQTVYVLAIPRTGVGANTTAKGTPGLYVSQNAGQTWRLATPASALPTHTMFSIGAGSASAGQVYTLIPSLGAQGLYASDDGGAHWRAMPPLPDARPTGVMGDPNRPGRVLLWSASTGLYTSDNGGVTWQPARGVRGGVFSVAVAGATIYASGDAGMYVSTDDGASFTLANTDYTFSAVVACPSAPAHAYALAGTAVYATRDGGHTWTATATTSSHPGNVSVDPSDPNTVYVGFSYPVGVEITADGGAHWRPILP